MALLTVKLEGNRGFALNESGANAITNTTAETNLFSTVIPAGKMGTNKILKFEITCHITTPVITVLSLTIKIKFGSTATLMLSNAAALSASIADKPVIIEGKIANLGSANSQFVVAKVYNNSGGILLSGLSSSFSATDGTWTVDTSVDQTLAVTAQFSSLLPGASIVAKLVEINLT